MFGGTETLRGDIRLAKRGVIDKLPPAKWPFIGTHENIRIGTKPLCKAGQDPLPECHHRVVIGKNPLAKEGRGTVRPLVGMDKRQAGHHISIIRRHLAAPEKHLLGIMRCRAFKICQPLRHPATLVLIHGDVALRRLVKREKGPACRHRPFTEACRNSMSRHIEEPNLGGCPDQRFGNPRLAGLRGHLRKVDHRDLAKINGPRRSVGRRVGHG